MLCTVSVFTDVRLTKLKIPVRICVQPHSVFLDFFVQYKLNLPDGFPPNQASALPSGSPVQLRVTVDGADPTVLL